MTTKGHAEPTVTVICEPCLQCGLSATVEMTAAQYQQLTQGRARQLEVLFPEWTRDQRELLITGTHSECWDTMLGPEPD